MAKEMTEFVLTDTLIADLSAPIRGKVRNTYDVSKSMGQPSLLIVATDRISAFDVVLNQGIPEKGKILTQLSLFWFDYLKNTNHLIIADIDDYPKVLRRYYREQLEGRSMIVEKHHIIPIECIVRGYLTGSGKKDYDKTGKVCWHKLPKGLVEASKLKKPIFTPSTKAEQGKHDENIETEQEALNIIDEFMKNHFPDITVDPREIYKFLEKISLGIFQKAQNYAGSKGIILADTKFEFGFNGHLIILCDEVLTPDSSRFWPLEGYKEGQSQPSFDKQFMRDYLLSVGFKGKEGQIVPNLPQDIIQETTKKYIEAYEMLTGKNYNF